MGEFQTKVMATFKMSAIQPAKSGAKAISVAKPPRQLPDTTEDEIYSEVRDGSRRVELVGDSMLLVKWSNAEWPARRYQYQACTRYTQNFLWGLLFQHKVLPRQDHLPFFRHVFRERNQHSDKLSKEAVINGSQLHVGVNLHDYFEFIFGAWDGAYMKDGSAGCGAILWGASQRCAAETWDTSNSFLLGFVGIQRRCESAIQAETCAHRALLWLLEGHLEKKRLVLDELASILERMCLLNLLNDLVVFLNIF